MAKQSSNRNGKSLVIVESPAKARTISRFLGGNFTVEASIGHVRDLPQGAKQIPAQYKGEDWAYLGVNVNSDFDPVYIIPPGKKAQVTKLKALLKDAKDLYLATDEDREGEAISWHLNELLKPKVPVHRLVFHEITKDAINEALEHPRDIDDSLIVAHRDLPELMPQLHLPVQSGSDRILDAMNRKHTRGDYLRVIERLRNAQPALAFTSDFIVGFPGETDRDFADTMKLIDEVGFSGSFSFKYSPRPGTPAAEMDDQVPEDVKSERLRTLQALIDRKGADFNRSCIGQTLDVLFEKVGRHPGQIVGKSPYLQPVQVMAPAPMIGTIASVRIDDTGSYSLFGTLAAGPAERVPQHTDLAALEA